MWHENWPIQLDEILMSQIGHDTKLTYRAYVELSMQFNKFKYVSVTGLIIPGIMYL